jgi:hypothetical protein
MADVAVVLIILVLAGMGMWCLSALSKLVDRTLTSFRGRFWALRPWP